MKNLRYYCFPDIHGRNDLLQKALTFVYSENPEGGKIIFLGDYIDRGPDSLGVLETVMNPPKNWEFICLLGNHEDMFVDGYSTDHIPYYDVNTAESIVKSPKLLDILKWFDNLKLFHIEDKNVFAHAYYNDLYAKETQSKDQCIWTRMSDTEAYTNRLQGLYLTHGHTPRKHGPIKAPNRLNLDAGAVFYDRFVIAEYYDGIKGEVNFHEFT